MGSDARLSEKEKNKWMPESMLSASCLWIQWSQTFPSCEVPLRATLASNCSQNKPSLLLWYLITATRKIDDLIPKTWKYNRFSKVTKVTIAASCHTEEILGRSGGLAKREKPLYSHLLCLYLQNSSKPNSKSPREK